MSAPAAGGARSSEIELTLGAEVHTVEARAVELSSHLIGDLAAAAAPEQGECPTQHAKRGGGDRYSDDCFAETRHSPAGIADARGEGLSLHVHLECHTVEVNGRVIGILHPQFHEQTQLQALALTLQRFDAGHCHL